MLLEQSNSFVNLNLQDVPRNKAVIRLECPVSHNLANVAEWKQIFIGDEPGTWWHCPECYGWHIALRKR